jgi:large subunit ribosomal protein L17
MRHRKHNHQLGVKSAHRVSLVANLSCSLIEHGRIKTTLAKARALRPAIEKIITLAKKAHVTDDAARKVHYRRLAIARLRNKKAVSKLFDELVDQFASRNGGYTRIYKLALPRLGDAADMALIEFVEELPKKKSSKKKAAKKKATTAASKENASDTPRSEEQPEAVETPPTDEAQPKASDSKETQEDPKSSTKSTEESTEPSSTTEQQPENSEDSSENKD